MTAEFYTDIAREYSIWGFSGLATITVLRLTYRKLKDNEKIRNTIGKTYEKIKSSF